jgi:putative inorganic carbon (HCO3(-)) transporter
VRPVPHDRSVVDSAAARLHAQRAPGTGTPGARNRRRIVASAGPLDANALYSLHVRSIWAFMKSQPASFWLVFIYLFFEYVRPQQIYERLAGPPYVKYAIALAVIAFIVEAKPIRFGLPEAMLAVFTGIVLASSFNALSSDASFDAIWDYLGWLVIYLLIANVVVTEERFLVFMLSFLLYSFKMSQSATHSWAIDGFIFRDWGVSGTPGWFGNSGEFGIQMCVFLPLVIAFTAVLRDRWAKWKRLFFYAAVITAITGIVASSSRGALFGLAAVALWMLLKSGKKWRSLLVALVLCAFTYAILPEGQKLRLQNMGDDQTSVTRTLYWHRGLDIMSQYPVLGIGYNNWAQYHRKNFGYTALPHNIFIQAGAELGYTGLGAFVLLIGCTFFVNWRTRRAARRLADGGKFIVAMAHGLDGALVGYVVSGFFITVLYYPYFWINFAMTVALHRVATASAAGGSVRVIAMRRPPLPVRGTA